MGLGKFAFPSVGKVRAEKRKIYDFGLPKVDFGNTKKGEFVMKKIVAIVGDAEIGGDEKK